MSVLNLMFRNAPLAGFRASRRYSRGLLDHLELGRQRRSLADLSPHQLRDIGLSQEAAQQEAARPIWDVPEHWRR